MWVSGSWLGPAPFLPTQEFPVPAGRSGTKPSHYSREFFPWLYSLPAPEKDFHTDDRSGVESICIYCVGENQCNVNRKSGLYVSSKHWDWKPHTPNEIHSCAHAGFRALSAGGEGSGSGDHVLFSILPLLLFLTPSKKKLIRHFVQFFNLFIRPSLVYRTRWFSWIWHPFHQLFQRDGARLCVSKRPHPRASREVCWTY